MAHLTESTKQSEINNWIDAVNAIRNLEKNNFTLKVSQDNRGFEVITYKDVYYASERINSKNIDNAVLVNLNNKLGLSQTEKLQNAYISDKKDYANIYDVADTFNFINRLLNEKSTIKFEHGDIEININDKNYKFKNMDFMDLSYKMNNYPLLKEIYEKKNNQEFNYHFNNLNLKTEEILDLIEYQNKQEQEMKQANKRKLGR